MRGAKAHALVWPLLMTSSGTKFGKTETGTIWLDAKRTSPYRFYQFWLNTEDRDVVNYLKYFTLLTQPEIEDLAASLVAHPEKREAQKKLAQEVTCLVHGLEALNKAEQASRILFGEVISNLSLQDLLDVFADVPSVTLSRSQFEGQGLSVVDVIALAALAPSKGEAKRLIQGGGVYLNNVRVSDIKNVVTLNEAVEGQAVILRKGQKEYRMVRLS